MRGGAPLEKRKTWKGKIEGVESGLKNTFGEEANSLRKENKVESLVETEKRKFFFLLGKLETQQKDDKNHYQR